MRDEENINLRAAYVESAVEEFGRILPQLVVLISPEARVNLMKITETLLERTWDSAQRPLLEALVKEMR